MRPKKQVTRKCKSIFKLFKSIFSLIFNYQPHSSIADLTLNVRDKTAAHVRVYLAVGPSVSKFITL